MSIKMRKRWERMLEMSCIVRSKSSVLRFIKIFTKTKLHGSIFCSLQVWMWSYWSLSRKVRLFVRRKKMILWLIDIFAKRAKCYLILWIFHVGSSWFRQMHSENFLLVAQQPPNRKRFYSELREPYTNFEMLAINQMKLFLFSRWK
jgi:hypothetical protein